MGYENERLAALYDQDLLDSGAEGAFDAFTNAAAMICETPIALISLIDKDRQWFKSAIGVQQGHETPREQAFCEHAIQGNELVFEVSDTHLDVRFQTNPLVTAEPFIRSYSGVTLNSQDGFALGTLCVIDREPKQLRAEQKAALISLAHGIEKLIQSRRAYRDTANRLAQIYVKTPALLCLVNDTGHILEVSDLWVTHFGYPRSEVIGRSLQDFVPVDSRGDLSVALDCVRAHGESVDTPTQFVNSQNEQIEVLMSAVLDTSRSQSKKQILCVLSDVTLQLKVHRALEKRSRLDEMTGIPNRAWFRERYRIEWDRVTRHNRRMSLIVFDIDNFKRVNDRYGHAAGDAVLIAIAEQARRLLRSADEVGRVGGDEFGLFLPETGLAGALVVANRLCRAVATLHKTDDGLVCPVSISLGVTELTPGLSEEGAFEQADQALYQAKHSGRNQVAQWSERATDCVANFPSEDAGADADTNADTNADSSDADAYEGGQASANLTTRRL